MLVLWVLFYGLKLGFVYCNYVGSLQTRLQPLDSMWWFRTSFMEIPIRPATLRSLCQSGYNLMEQFVPHSIPSQLNFHGLSLTYSIVMAWIMAYLSSCNQINIFSDTTQKCWKPRDYFVQCSSQDKGFEDAKPVIAALKNKGFSAIGAAGFCWGGECFLLTALVGRVFCIHKHLLALACVPSVSKIQYNHLMHLTLTSWYRISQGGRRTGKVRLHSSCSTSTPFPCHRGWY